MYTVGKVSDFLGVSKDTLKFYEQKGLVNPNKDDANGYRLYDHFDIYDVIATNFYREIDIEIKKIQEIRRSKSVEEIENLLMEKEEAIANEIESKKLLLQRIHSVKQGCERIQEYLGEYTIKEMKPLVVKDEISNFKAYDEYKVIRKNTDHPRTAVTLSNLRRIVSFDDTGITGDRFVVVQDAQNCDFENGEEVLSHSRCIYTIVEDGRFLNAGNSIDDEVGTFLRTIVQDNGYELLGIVYANILLTSYKEGLERVFLEIYAPINK